MKSRSSRRRDSFVPAAAAVCEALEHRRLLAGDFEAGVALPYRLDFNRPAIGVVDRDGTGTGFTWVQPNATGTEYQTRKMDLRIAATVLDRDGVLVTRNTKDFKQIPGLVFEDWSK